MPDLRGKTAVVTGATSGIGEVCARELAGMGATVVLAVRSQQKADATFQRIMEKYPDAKVVKGPLLDMKDNDSIRAFAAEYQSQGRPLHILVNNAGALTDTQNYSKEGVAELAQINHLGPYLLTRLLEGVLLASAPARVVNVASITHRMGVIGDPTNDFLKGDYGHYYWNTKLANVLHAYELQRRLGKHGVQCCAADPGGVRTDVWRNSSWIVKRAVEVLYAPIEAGANVLLYAAVAPWHTNGDKGGDCNTGRAQLPAEKDLRYYAPLVFASPLVTWYGPAGGKGSLQRLMMRWFGMPFANPWAATKHGIWVMASLATSVVDWPLRQMLEGKVQEVRLAPSSPLSYDADLSRDLWNASADVAGVSHDTIWR